jgi:hypothetical protein
MHEGPVLRVVALGTWLALVVAACGGGGLSLTEYAEEVEALVADVGRRVDDLDAGRESRPVTVESEKQYWDARVAARVEFRDGMRALDPPEEVDVMHMAGLGIISRLTDAEQQVAARAALMQTNSDIDELYRSPEAAAWQAIDGEAVEICKAAQAEIDATEDRAAFEGNLWIPPELKEIVSVAFGCTAEQRGAGG